MYIASGNARWKVIFIFMRRHPPDREFDSFLDRDCENATVKVAVHAPTASYKTTIKYIVNSFIIGDIIYIYIYIYED